MTLTIESRHLNDVVVLIPEIFQDERGFFMETFRKDQFLELGLPGEFAQDRRSWSGIYILYGEGTSETRR